jgi:uncharacterized protein (DUF697 family)
MSPATEPVVLATLLAPLLTWLGAYYGLSVSPEKATSAAFVILTVGAGLARSMVRTKATLPDPTATKTNTAVQVASRGTRVVEPTTYTPPAAKPHRRARPPDDDPPPTGP